MIRERGGFVGIGTARAGVLLCTQDHPTGRSYVEALEAATIPVEWVRTPSELQTRLDRSDLPRPALVMVLPSRQTPLQPSELASVAARLATESSQQPTTPALADALNGYCAKRLLSRRQRQVLELYLNGNNDKEIADAFRCSGTTVYEHWRRMARKANGSQKSDVVTDFHRFLAGRSGSVSWPPGSPPRSEIPDP